MSVTLYYFSIYLINLSSIAKLIQNNALGVINDMLASGYVWIILLFVPFIALIPDFLMISVQAVFFPNILQYHRALANHPDKAFIE